MTRASKPYESKRECIKAVKYTYSTTRGQRFKRIVLGEIREAKSHECPDCKSELEVGGLGALICKNESCGFCRQIYYEYFEKVKEK